MKIKIHYCMIDCGDGSTTRENFKTEDEALAREQEELDGGYPVPCEAVGWEIFDTDGYEVIE